MSAKAIIIILRKRLFLRAGGRGKARITELLDLDGASKILIQISPFTDEKTKQRGLAQGHQLVSSGPATGIQKVVLKILGVEFRITGVKTLEARDLDLRPVSRHPKLTWASHLISTFR